MGSRDDPERSQSQGEGCGSGNAQAPRPTRTGTKAGQTSLEPTIQARRRDDPLHGSVQVEGQTVEGFAPSAAVDTGLKVLAKRLRVARGQLPISIGAQGAPCLITGHHR